MKHFWQTHFPIISVNWSLNIQQKQSSIHLIEFFFLFLLISVSSNIVFYGKLINSYLHSNVSLSHSPGKKRMNCTSQKVNLILHSNAWWNFSEFTPNTQFLSHFSMKESSTSNCNLFCVWTQIVYHICTNDTIITIDQQWQRYNQKKRWVYLINKKVSDYL